MGRALDKISITGFKSIKELAGFELSSLNVLIGGNGAGKSNFIEIFRMLRAMVGLNFGEYVLDRGGADDFLYNGPKVTKQITTIFEFGKNKYGFLLEPTADDKFIIKEEKQKYELGSWKNIGSGDLESKLPSVKDDSGWMSAYGVGHYVYDSVSNWTVYHFHDTSNRTPMRRYEIVEDNKYLRPDAANIAPYLYKIKTKFNETYQEIIDSIRMVTPFFDDFILEPVKKGEKEKINLSWLQKGSDYPMQPYHFSDGTIRFICLVAALIQPNYPSVILIDEPELGLHPYAVDVLAELIKAASEETQVIISTQSPALVNSFDPDDIVIVDRKDGASTFNRLNKQELDNWLEEYTLGELWVKNIFSGGPTHE